jgi:hypothetical protein
MTTAIARSSVRDDLVGFDRRIDCIRIFHKPSTCAQRMASIGESAHDEHQSALADGRSQGSRIS